MFPRQNRDTTGIHSRSFARRDARFFFLIVRARAGAAESRNHLLAFYIEMNDFGEIVRLEIISSVPNRYLRDPPDPWRGTHRQEHSPGLVRPR